MVNRSCSTSGNRRVNLVTNPVVRHELGKDREVFMTSGKYPWSFKDVSSILIASTNRYLGVSEV